MTRAQDLVGTFVIEVGERQAWPFMTFCDNEATPSREARLYIDTEFTVNDSNNLMPHDIDYMARLLHLNTRRVITVDVRDAELSIRFEDGNCIVVSGISSAWTTHDVWWLGPWIAQP